jgi:hypothetical protein
MIHSAINLDFITEQENYALECYTKLSIKYRERYGANAGQEVFKLRFQYTADRLNRWLEGLDIAELENFDIDQYPDYRRYSPSESPTEIDDNSVIELPLIEIEDEEALWYMNCGKSG